MEVLIQRMWLSAKTTLPLVGTFVFHSVTGGLAAAPG